MSVRIQAATWNELLTDMVPLLRNRILSITALGRNQSWRHPWFTSLKWDAEAKSWLATVRPGTVDGRDVTVSVTVKDETKDVPLTDAPAFPVGGFRAIGTDGVSIDGSGEKVPPFFLARGVAEPIAISTEGDTLTQTITGLVSDQESQRILRACDIVLRCYRPRSIIDWTITPAETGAQAQISVGVTGSSAHRATLHVVTQHQVTPTTADLALLAGTLPDPGYDEAKICTVYLLSPAGAAYEGTPDGTWQPYVEHFAFWPADYTVARPVLPAATQNIEVNLAGLGGIAGAQITVNQILSLQNDAVNNAITQLTSSLTAGKISTPGHRRAAVKWDPEKSLDPPFPFFGF